MLLSRPATTQNRNTKCVRSSLVLALARRSSVINHQTCHIATASRAAEGGTGAAASCMGDMGDKGSAAPQLLCSGLVTTRSGTQSATTRAPLASASCKSLADQLRGGGRSAAAPPPVRTPLAPPLRTSPRACSASLVDMLRGGGLAGTAALETVTPSVGGLRVRGRHALHSVASAKDAVAANRLLHVLHVRLLIKEGAHVELVVEFCSKPSQISTQIQKTAQI